MRSACPGGREMLHKSSIAPKNILGLSSSTGTGWRAALSIALGACAGAAAIVLLVGWGGGGALVEVLAIAQTV